VLLPSSSFLGHLVQLFAFPAHPRGMERSLVGSYDSSKEEIRAVKINLKINFLALLQQLRLGAS
jgi:hypothetical protein